MRAKAIATVIILCIVALSGFACGCGGEEAAPTQSKIAFTSDRDGAYEIYVMDTDGSNQTRLTSNPAEDEFPSWSP